MIESDREKRRTSRERKKHVRGGAALEEDDVFFSSKARGKKTGCCLVRGARDVMNRDSGGKRFVGK